MLIDEQLPTIGVRKKCTQAHLGRDVIYQSQAVPVELRVQRRGEESQLSWWNNRDQSSSGSKSRGDHETITKLPTLFRNVIACENWTQLQRVELRSAVELGQYVDPMLEGWSMRSRNTFGAPYNTTEANNHGSYTGG